MPIVFLNSDHLLKTMTLNSVVVTGALVVVADLPIRSSVYIRSRYS